jgi:hypothetical protein
MKRIAIGSALSLAMAAAVAAAPAVVSKSLTVKAAPGAIRLWQFSCRHYLTAAVPHRHVEIRNIGKTPTPANLVVLYTFSVHRVNDTQRTARLPALAPNAAHVIDGMGLPFLANNQKCTVSVP